MMKWRRCLQRLPVWRIVLLWLGWQAVILAASYLATRGDILPFVHNYIRYQDLERQPLPVWWRRLGGFDGMHYYTYANGDYFAVSGLQAFFPVYPLLIRLLQPLVGGNTLLTGLVISSVSLLGFLLVAYRLVGRRHDERAAWIFLLLMLCQPASFFFLTVYTESLFCLLMALTLDAYDRGRFGQVAFWGAILSATRVVGIVVPAALGIYHLFQAWRHHRLRQSQTWRQLSLIALGSVGLLAYMGFLWFYFADPLYFRTVQAQFGAGRDSSHLILLPQVIWRYCKMLYVGLQPTWKSYAVVQEFVIGLTTAAGLMGAFLVNWRHKREVLSWTWWLFSVGFYIIPTLTGTFSSLTRYVLPCIIIPEIGTYCVQKYPKLAGVIIGLSSGLMLWNTMLFVQGFWVS